MTISRTTLLMKIDNKEIIYNSNPKMEDHFTWAHCGSFRSSMEGFLHGGKGDDWKVPWRF